MSTSRDAAFVRRQFSLLLLEMAATAVLGDAVDDETGVVSLAFTATHSSDGLIVLEGEYRDRAGQALGGFGL